MSLDTVLNIGRTIRNNVENESEKIKFFRFARKPDIRNWDKNYWFSVNVIMDQTSMIIDWNSLSNIPENQRDNMVYFLNKTSEQDTSAPTYMFGDIFYTIKMSVEKSNSYRIQTDNSLDKLLKDKDILKPFLSTDKKKNKREFSLLKSYLNGDQLEEDSLKFIQSIIGQFAILKFWRMVKLEKDNIETILSCAPIVNGQKFLKQEALKDLYKQYVLHNLSGKKDVKSVIDSYIDKKKKENIDIKAKDVSLVDLGDAANEFLKVGEHSAFLHFNFQDEKGSTTSWYEQKHMCSYLYKYLIEKISETNDGMTVLNNLIYPTLCSGDDKNDRQFPDFRNENKYKSFFFSEKGSSLYDLLYADRIFGKTRKWIKGTDVNIIVLPRCVSGDIDVNTLLAFFFENKSETSLFDTSCFACFDGIDEKQIVFDYVFVNNSGQTSIYLFDISGLQKSLLKEIEARINNIERKISDEVQEEHHWNDFKTSIEDAYTYLIGTCQNKDGEIKIVNTVKNPTGTAPYAPYQSHLLKVVPKIYSKTFYADELLLASLIEKIEFCVRNADGNDVRNWYIKLKYRFKFILDIQNNTKSKYMEITGSPSYQAGLKLGQLAKPLGKKINSFQKNYVGMLTRRASSKEDCIVLTNDIFEKLVMHDCSYQTLLCGKMCAEIASLSGYDKEHFAFGFFEGYFKYLSNDSKEKFVEKAEKLVSDFSGNSELTETLNCVRNIVDELKN